MQGDFVASGGTPGSIRGANTSVNVHRYLYFGGYSFSSTFEVNGAGDGSSSDSIGTVAFDIYHCGDFAAHSSPIRHPSLTGGSSNPNAPGTVKMQMVWSQSYPLIAPDEVPIYSGPSPVLASAYFGAYQSEDGGYTRLKISRKITVTKYTAPGSYTSNFTITFSFV